VVISMVMCVSKEKFPDTASLTDLVWFLLLCRQAEDG